MSIIAKDLATENGDFIFVNGDFKITNSNQEHAVAIITSNVGEWKQHPKIGVGIKNYLNGPGISSNLIIEQEARKQLLNDGFKVQDLKILFDLVTNKMQVKTNAIRIR